MQIADESGPFGDYERELVKQLPDWEQHYACFDAAACDFVNNWAFALWLVDFLSFNEPSIDFSAVVLVPTTAESVALTPPPIALYESGERVVDVERFLCLPSLSGVTGVVCVPAVERHSTHKTIDKSWLESIRKKLVEQLCA